MPQRGGRLVEWDGSGASLCRAGCEPGRSRLDPGRGDRCPCCPAGCPPARGIAPVRHDPGRGRRPAGVPKRGRRAGRASRARPGGGRVALLVALKEIERAFGRRKRERWGPREVDLDLLVFGRHAVRALRPPEGRSADPAKAPMPLVVPHVEARSRLFVLAPLSDLSPGLVPPGWGETVATAAARRRAVEGADSARAIATWDGCRWRPLSEPAGGTRGTAPPG